ncbi:hypothetical protein B0G81_2338 [Paraburkholderia sp. BL6665CI2N2]|uniref:hypothetical protein n=1 Tax=Paraburkholderia sp. BL6665CI2N2 TaxID=1938806 RepID=UPI001065D01F|nr:hypothetical protein [Paraburkholderia sp. BL6665CI2N2]TDY22061.1 hypothetical protein B0G81_2338 [Paraburkholderia sp. BL6665CI2N2]
MSYEVPAPVWRSDDMLHPTRTRSKAEQMYGINVGNGAYFIDECQDVLDSLVWLASSCKTIDGQE